MPKGAAISEGSSGENISHFAAIRLRISGLCQFQMRIYTLDHEMHKVLVPLNVIPVNRTLQTRIINYTTQRALFEFKTTQINEFFKINRIVIFMKEIYTSYPGN